MNIYFFNISSLRTIFLFLPNFTIKSFISLKVLSICQLIYIFPIFLSYNEPFLFLNISLKIFKIFKFEKAQHKKLKVQQYVQENNNFHGFYFKLINS
jgi:hypothetical protein